MRRERQETAAVLLLPVMVFTLAVLAVLFLWEDHDRTPKIQEGKYEEIAPAVSSGSESGKEKGREDELLERMTLNEKVAQLFMITPEALTGVNLVTAAGDATREAFSDRPVGGIIYFEENLQEKLQTEAMLSSMQRIAMERLRIPVLLGTDEEGGRVTRIAGCSDFGVENPGPMGSLKTVEAAGKAGETIGTYLGGLGFNMDFAPVADVNENPENTVIGDRAFSDDPKEASDLVKAAIEGFKKTKTLTVLKHFPGHGSTKEDSHLGYAYNNKTEEELRNTDFLPFRAGIEAGADMVMVGHISLPNILPDDTPASLSKTVVTDYLRGDLGFDGVVVTDAMNMGAIKNNYTSAESARMALEAGVDLLLMPKDFEEAYQGLLLAIQEGTITEERINESVRRILKMKLRYM